LLHYNGIALEAMLKHDTVTNCNKAADAESSGVCPSLAEPLDFSVSADEARAVNQRLRKKGASAGKQSIVRRTPLRAGAGRKVRGSTNRRAELLSRLEAARELPANSTYARHRKACLEKALQLLDCERCAARFPPCHIQAQQVPARLDGPGSSCPSPWRCGCTAVYVLPTVVVKEAERKQSFLRTEAPSSRASWKPSSRALTCELRERHHLSGAVAEPRLAPSNRQARRMLC